jgi:hypothetical protein
VTSISKCRTSDKNASSGKEQRKSIPLEEKLNVAKRYERNERMDDLANAMDIPVSTLRAIRKEDEKLWKTVKAQRE